MCDYFLFPGMALASGAASLTLGVASFGFLHYVVGPRLALKECASRRMGRGIFLYLLGCSVVFCWRGVWCLWDGAWPILWDHARGVIGGPSAGAKMVSEEARIACSGAASQLAGFVGLCIVGFASAVVAPPLSMTVFRDARHLFLGLMPR